MADREITPRQKQFIIENKNTHTPEELARHLNLTVKEVNNVIDSYIEPEVEEEAVDIVPTFIKSDTAKIFVALLAITAMAFFYWFGFYFRMMPERKLDNIMLDYDYAFHLRMTESVLHTGAIPEMDEMAWYPEGKPVRQLLPVFLYYLGAGFHAVAQHITDFTVQDSIIWFYGLFCPLIIFPIFMLLRHITRRNDIALIGAGLAALMPANLVRTLCTRYRYEGPGVIFLFINMYFFMKAVETKSRSRFYIYTITSTFFMMLSIGTWRVSLLFPTVYCIVFLILFLLRRTNAHFLGAFSFQSLGVVLCSLFYTFLRSQNYIFSHNALLITGLGIVAALTKWWQHDRDDAYVKVKPKLLLIPLAMVAIIPLFHLSTGYESFLNVLVLKIRFMVKKFRVTGISNILFMNTAELSSVSPLDFFKWDLCSWAAVFIAYYPVSLFFLKRKDEKLSFGELLISVFFFIVLFLSLLFYRNKVLLAPFTALVGGLSIWRTFNFLRRVKFHNPIAIGIYIATVIVLVGTGLNTANYISKLRVSMRAHLQDALINLDKINAQRLPVLSYWSYGYVVQTYAQSPTYLDGLLESPLVHERLVEVSNLLLQNDEEKFYNFCKDHGLGVMFVDKYNSRTQLYALYAEKNYFQYFDQQGRPTDFGKDTIRSRSIYNPNSLKHFKLAYYNPRFNIYFIE